jgi:MazG family protein
MTTPGSRFDELVRIVATLRSPEGCPWDRAQTLASLRPFLLEETYEALDALDRADAPGLREELGDLLFEVVFLARIAEEDDGFSIADAIDAIATKLVRRHPHVFGDAARLSTPGEVLGRWEELKAAEARPEGRPRTILGGVPRTLPSLLRAYEYGSRAAAVGFDWQRSTDVIEKIEEEVRELREELTGLDRAGSGAIGLDRVGSGSIGLDRVEEEMGDLLFAIANLSRKLGVEPESALRRANEKFAARFTAVEQRITRRGERLQDKTLDELEAEWQAVKRED